MKVKPPHTETKLFMNFENQQPQAPVVPTREWVITYLIMIIPLVNIIMLFVWAFGSSENPNKANWAKARLIWIAIGIALFFVLWFTVIGAFIAAYQGGMMNNDF
jgi:hypothetical protein